MPPAVPAYLSLSPLKSSFLNPAAPPSHPSAPAAVDKDVLRINVEKTEEKEEEDKERKFHRWERSSQFVGRALRMPENANLEGVTARYVNGVLMLEGEAGCLDSHCSGWGTVCS